MNARGISEPIVEDLYGEALLLADEVRAAFDMRDEARMAREGEEVRIAMSIEGLRTTTRIMHVLAWLLNQRAFLSGELSESQLRRIGTLPSERASDPEMLALLEGGMRALVRKSERLHARVARLDREWRAQANTAGAPVQSLQGRIARAFAAG